MPSVNWIYYLRKSLFQLQLRELQWQAAVTVEQLRERLVAFVREHPEEFRADIPASVWKLEGRLAWYSHTRCLIQLRWTRFTNVI
jgi:hypothetical protein